MLFYNPNLSAYIILMRFFSNSRLILDTDRKQEFNSQLLDCITQFEEAINDTTKVYKEGTGFLYKLQELLTYFSQVLQDCSLVNQQLPLILPEELAMKVLTSLYIPLDHPIDAKVIQKVTKEMIKEVEKHISHYDDMFRSH